MGWKESPKFDIEILWFPQLRLGQNRNLILVYASEIICPSDDNPYQSDNSINISVMIFWKIEIITEKTKLVNFSYDRIIIIPQAFWILIFPPYFVFKFLMSFCYLQLLTCFISLLLFFLYICFFSNFLTFQHVQSLLFRYTRTCISLT